MENNIWVFILIGFIAQVIDGSIGMAYGVFSNTMLLSFGISPVASSASIHMAEVFTTGTSAISHSYFKNVNWGLVKRLIIPGMIGGVIGVYFLSNINTEIIKPIVAIYLMLMGLRIIYRVINHKYYRERKGWLIPLGFVGGTMDAIGGGGWGPIVTTTLTARGGTPRYVIGSVNTSEFFVTLAESVAFSFTIGFVNWKIIVGLIIGGVMASWFAAWLCSRIPPRILMGIVGIVIVILSIRTIILIF